MEIRIDTNKDSKEHIRHMIEFLQRFVGAQSSNPPGGLFGDSTSSGEPAPAFLGMFGEGVPAAPSKDLEEEEREERVEIVPY